MEFLYWAYIGGGVFVIVAFVSLMVYAIKTISSSPLIPEPNLNNMKTIRDKVNNFKTKHEPGFIKSEIDELLKDYPDINMEKFNNALMGITCMRMEDETVIYHCDIEKALYCGLENRDLKSWEWD